MSMLVMHDLDHDLDDAIIEVVCKADAAGQPVTVSRGPFYDRRLKAALAVRGVHQSVICWRVKQLVKTGMLRQELTGRKYVTFLGERTREYPEVRLLPA